MSNDNGGVSAMSAELGQSCPDFGSDHNQSAAIIRVEREIERLRAEELAETQALMLFDPADGSERPYPSQAEMWRQHHGLRTAWLFDPWRGNRRSAQDVGSDPLGHLIVPEPNTGNEGRESAPLI